MTEHLDAAALWDLVEARAAATPDAEMLVDHHGRRITFGEYRDAALVAAAGLRDLGVETGTVVSWMLPTWIESVVLVGALSRLGAVQNPILTIYRDREVGFAVQEAEPLLLLVPGTWGGFDFAEMAGRLTADTSTDVVVCDPTLPAGDPSTLPAWESPADDPIRWIFYTSGTTSSPKGATHGDSAIRAASIGMDRGLGLTAEDRSILAFPFTHIGGITWLHAGLMTGLTNILDESFTPSGTVPLMVREGVTQAGSGTYFHQTYLAAQKALPEGEQLFPGVRAFPGGGSPKPPAFAHDMLATFGAPIVSGYGLTEAPILTMANVTDSPDALATTEGSATPGVELRLVTLDDKVAGIGEEGEVRAKGPQITRGYVDASLDAKAFDDEGWFRTGDLGVLDVDGNLTITGRIKDVIIRKGENISAKELEDLLFTHPLVADVAVVGLADESAGEIACAVVVPKDPDAPLGFTDMQDHLLAAGLITRKLPERLEHVAALPRNPAGKIVKFQLRDQFGG